MSNINQTRSDNLEAINTANGAVVEPERVGATKGVTLAAGTYVFVLDKAGPVVDGIHLQWSAALAATITFEVTNFPELVGGRPQGANDVTDHSVTAGEWVQLNPGTAYVPVSGTGNSVANLTITAGGTNAGAAWVDLGNLGARRVRVKVVVTTQGVLRVGSNGRSACK